MPMAGPIITATRFAVPDDGVLREEDRATTTGSVVPLDAPDSGKNVGHRDVSSTMSSTMVDTSVLQEGGSLGRRLVTTHQRSSSVDSLGILLRMPLQGHLTVACSISNERAH
jgi:hypothetical protein